MVSGKHTVHALFTAVSVIYMNTVPVNMLCLACLSVADTDFCTLQ